MQKRYERGKDNINSRNQNSLKGGGSFNIINITYNTYPDPGYEAMESTTSVNGILRLLAIDEEEAQVHVQGPVTHFLDDLCDHDFTLFFFPAEDFAEEAVGVGLDARRHVLALEAADLFHIAVSWPWADRDLTLVSKESMMRVTRSGMEKGKRYGS